MSFLGIKNPFRTGAGAVQRDAVAAADARQGRGANLTMMADSIFADPRREAGVQDFMGALRTQLGDATDRGFSDAARRTKFATARQGLTGGSVDLSRQTRSLEELFRRRLGNETQVQDAGNGLRTQDLATRQQLLAGTYGTADVGQDALRSLLARRATNAGVLRSAWPGLATDLGGTLSDAYSRQAEREAYLAGAGGG